jgi:hypothetical protein
MLSLRWAAAAPPVAPPIAAAAAAAPPPPAPPAPVPAPAPAAPAVAAAPALTPATGAVVPATASQVAVAAPPAAAPPPVPPAQQHMPMRDRPPLPSVPSVPAITSRGELVPVDVKPLPLTSQPTPKVPSLEAAEREHDKSWNAFTDLRKQLEESHGRTLSLHTEISKTQVSHEKEAAELQARTQKTLEDQRRESQEMRDNYNSAQAKLDHLTGILGRKAEEQLKLEQAVRDMEHKTATVEQRHAHTKDRLKLADDARQVAEVRARELELSLEHATMLLTSLRAQLGSANEDKTKALQEQHEAFEANRQQLIQFYSEREQYTLGSYNDSLSNVQASMHNYIVDREKEVEKHWQATFEKQLEHHDSLQKELLERCEMHHQDLNKATGEHEKEKERWLAHMEREITEADRRAREREEHVLADIARRERELGEREQKMRVQITQVEQDAKVQLLAREAEQKARFDKMIEDVRQSYETDRQRLVDAFREQLAAIAAQHLAAEKDLERMHRDKEREMAQRYRLAGYEMEDQKSTMDMEKVTTRTQDSLLGKFESIAARQRERADMQRTRMSTGREGSTAREGSTLREGSAAPSATASAAPSNAASPRR